MPLKYYYLKTSNLVGQLSLERQKIEQRSYYLIQYAEIDLQYAEADFLWKVDLKILISGIILKIFSQVD